MQRAASKKNKIQLGFHVILSHFHFTAQTRKTYTQRPLLFSTYRKNNVFLYKKSFKIKAMHEVTELNFQRKFNNWGDLKRV